MSIVIRGLNKPRDCSECPVCVYHAETGKTWCIPQDKLLADNFRAIPFDGRDKGCTISELPEKHGRLVDADELFDQKTRSASSI